MVTTGECVLVPPQTLRALAVVGDPVAADQLALIIHGTVARVFNVADRVDRLLAATTVACKRNSGVGVTVPSVGLKKCIRQRRSLGVI